MALSKIPSAGFQDNVKFRNIIINGDMSIAQRGTSASSITSSSYNTCDRWRVFLGSLGTWTQSQSTDVPSGQGFSTSLKMDCTTADASPSASDELIVAQSIEGQNLQYLKFGTSSAESLTVSFWVKSNKTGTYICELFHEEGSNDKTINKSYTIDSADTWEKKTITFAGDTAKAFDNDNALTLNLSFWLGAGSNFTSGTLATSWETRTNANRAVGQVNLADSTSNEWYVTGVQLEAGEVASDFEFLPYDVNLGRCYRYYETIVEAVAGGKCIGMGGYYNSSSLYLPIRYKVQKRVTPSLDQVTGTDYYIRYSNSGNDGFNQFSTARMGRDSGLIYNESQTTGTSGSIADVSTNNATSFVALDAEL